MNSFSPFTGYDFFAYIAGGVLALALTDFLFTTELFIGRNAGAVEVVLLVFATYIAGHIVASAAALLFERLLVNRVIGSPSISLLDRTGSANERTIFLRKFKRPLDAWTIQQVRTKGRSARPPVENGEELFRLAFAFCRHRPDVRPRLDAFLQLYGFCRNVSFVALVASILIGARLICTDWFPDTKYAEQDLMWLLVSLTVWSVMFSRYLKFYRLYAVEVFTVFAADIGETG